MNNADEVAAGIHDISVEITACCDVLERSEAARIASLISMAEHKARCEQMLTVCRFLTMSGYADVADYLGANISGLVKQKEWM